MIYRLPEELKVRLNNESVELYEQIIYSAQNTEAVFRKFGLLGNLTDYNPRLVELHFKRIMIDKILAMYMKEDEHFPAALRKKRP